MQDTLLLFDLDGTLWDSAARVAESWNIIFQREDPSLPILTADDIHSVMGMTMKEIQNVLQPALKNELRDSVFAECCTFEVEYLRQHGGDAYPDLRPALEALRALGYSLAVVSNCQCGYIDAFLNSSGTADLFCDYEEWERTGLSKGENIRLVMERNGFTKGVYIGDTQKDRDAALQAGIPFIHASYGFGKVDSADGVIRSLSELPDEISRLLSRPASV